MPAWLRTPVLVHANAPAATAVSTQTLLGATAPRQNPGGAQTGMPGLHRSVRLLTLHAPAIVPKPNAEGAVVAVPRPPTVPEHLAGEVDHEAAGDVGTGNLPTSHGDLPLRQEGDEVPGQQQAQLVRAVQSVRRVRGVPVLLPAGPIFISTLPPV